MLARCESAVPEGVDRDHQRLGWSVRGRGQQLLDPFQHAAYVRHGVVAAGHDFDQVGDETREVTADGLAAQSISVPDLVLGGDLQVHLAGKAGSPVERWIDLGGRTVDEISNDVSA